MGRGNRPPSCSSYDFERRRVRMMQDPTSGAAIPRPCSIVARAQKLLTVTIDFAGRAMLAVPWYLISLCLAFRSGSFVPVVEE